MRKWFIALIFLIVASIFLTADVKYNCFTVVAGKNTTVDGSVLIAHNEDDTGEKLLVNIFKVPALDHKPGSYIITRKGQQIPQVNHTFSYLWFQVPGVDFADSYINENGVFIVSNACSSREKDQVLNGGIGFMLRRIVAGRAKSARDGVKIAGRLIEKYGYYSSGRNYTIADSNEAWFLHAVKGKHWVAQRVPDDQVAVIANSYTIRDINLKDQNNFLGSSDIRAYALEQKWYNPEWEDRFDFAKVYSNVNNFSAEANVLRQWRGTNLLSDEKFPIEERLPFSFIPKRKIEVTNLFHILRDHYEGTKYDLTNKYKKGSPNSTEKRTICTKSTQYSLVAQLRNQKPKLIKDILWVALRRPDSNSFTPWYIHALKDVPAGYQSEDYQTALKTHFSKPDEFFNYDLDHYFSHYAILSELVDEDYKERNKIVSKEWKRYESYILKAVKKQEKEFEYFISFDPNVARNIIDNLFKRYEYRKLIRVMEFVSFFRQNKD